jgi:predicted transcriptional regulator
VTDSKVKYRSRTDIIASILQSAGTETNGVGVTRLMYSSFLSYKQVNQYLQVLKENALLNYNATSKKYIISAKGLKFMELYSKIEKILQPETESHN